MHRGINSIWEKMHSFPWPQGFPSIIILFLFPTFSRCFSIIPWLHCLTSHSLSLSSFLPLFCLQLIPRTLFFLPTQWNQSWRGHQTPFTGWSLLFWSPFFTWLLRHQTLLVFFLPHWLNLRSLICLLLLSASSIPPSVSNLTIFGAPGLSLEFFLHSSQMISWLLKLSTCSWFSNYTRSPR